MAPERLRTIFANYGSRNSHFLVIYGPRNCTIPDGHFRIFSEKICFSTSTYNVFIGIVAFGFNLGFAIFFYLKKEKQYEQV
jgi:hypothetical protein